MAEVHRLGPLTLTCDGGEYRFTLSTPLEMTLELPPEYERELVAQLARILPPHGAPRFTFDLQDLPAISSRQLGLMLALHKVLRPRTERLPVTGASAAVRRLLTVTRTAQFFDLAP